MSVDGVLCCLETSKPATANNQPAQPAEADQTWNTKQPKVGLCLTVKTAHVSLPRNDLKGVKCGTLERSQKVLREYPGETSNNQYIDLLPPE
jgi:hypothetical protein